MKTLRPYQREALDAIYKYYNQGNMGNPIISLATGGGKSLVIANLIREVTSEVLILSHTKEIIQQNAAELTSIAPEIPIGIYSASLNSKQTEGKAIFGTIQSVARAAEQFTRFKTIVVDEAHRISDSQDTQYQQLLDIIKPDRIIGVTATPFRMNAGMLTDGQLFDEIVYDVGIKYLIKHGYLCPLRTKVSSKQPDLSKISVRGGEYVNKELSDLMDDEKLIKDTVASMMEYGQDRKKWLIFCSSIKHAESVSRTLRQQGIASECVHSKLSEEDRKQNLELFNKGALRAICNVDVLTTGFNEPAIDMVVLLRPTKSLGLHIQMIGRGSRLHESKKDCLVLDYAGNIAEHGPIDMPHIRSKKKGEAVKYTHKVCVACEEAIPINAKECPECGYEFISEERSPGHKSKPDTEAPLFKEPPKWYVVDSVTYERHKGKKGVDSMKVTYYADYRSFSEWICLNHTGFAKEKADAWAKARRVEDSGNYSIECHSCDGKYGHIKDGMVHCNKCGTLVQSPKIPQDAIEEALWYKYKQPSQILVERDGKYDRIVNYIWETKPEPIEEILQDEIIF